METQDTYEFEYQNIIKLFFFIEQIYLVKTVIFILYDEKRASVCKSFSKLIHFFQSMNYYYSFMLFTKQVNFSFELSQRIYLEKC